LMPRPRGPSRTIQSKHPGQTCSLPYTPGPSVTRSHFARGYAAQSPCHANGKLLLNNTHASLQVNLFVSIVEVRQISKPAGPSKLSACPSSWLQIVGRAPHARMPSAGESSAPKSQSQPRTKSLFVAYNSRLLPRMPPPLWECISGSLLVLLLPSRSHVNACLCQSSSWVLAPHK
jgi:hypothetical protein